jgi:hypothetical protein
MSAFLNFVSESSCAEIDAEIVTEATGCLDRFTRAFNACDPAAMDAELHFPHTMLSGAQVPVWECPGQHPSDLFPSLRQAGWALTRYEARQPVLVSCAKVHFVLVYTRRSEAGEVISTHRTLWIVTKVAGKWGIALRSY